MAGSVECFGTNFSYSYPLEGTGGGVPEDSVRAYLWFSMAKVQDYGSAAANLSSLKPMMTKQQIAEAQVLAAKCYESNYQDCD